MYQWIPKKTNTTDRKLTFLLFAGGAALILVTNFAPELPGKWVFQLIAVALLTAAVFLVARYQGKCFVYRVEEGREGSYDLTVTETNSRGKRAVTVCRVGLSAIASVRLIDFSDGGDSLSFWQSFCKGRKKIHDYTVDLKPVRSILVTVEEGGETLYLRLSPIDELYDLLRRQADEGAADA